MRCPECGKWMFKTTSGGRICAYAHVHKSKKEVYK